MSRLSYGFVLSEHGGAGAGAGSAATTATLPTTPALPPKGKQQRRGTKDKKSQAPHTPFDKRLPPLVFVGSIGDCRPQEHVEGNHSQRIWDWEWRELFTRL